MKKTLLIAASFLSLMNLSCISDDWEDKSVNTTVIEQPIAGKFLKNVLIEDYTGTWCQFCPRVLYGLDGVESEGLDAYPVSIHRSVASYTDPFSFPAAALEQTIGVSGYPTAMLNRKTLWDNEIATTEVKNQIKPNADLGIALNSTVTAGNINLDVNIKFVENFSDLKLVVYILEDGLLYNQVNETSFYGGQNPIPNMEHNHVLRTCLTDLVNGDALTGTSNGATITKNFSIAMPSNISNVTKISFVAFVMDASGKAINVRGVKPNITQTFQENL
ncbi:MAG: Omp28-related outer membrane protein [Bacteroidota bacterium]